MQLAAIDVKKSVKKLYSEKTIRPYVVGDK